MLRVFSVIRAAEVAAAEGIVDITTIHTVATIGVILTPDRVHL